MSKELLKTWALTLLKVPALIPTTSNLHWYHVNEISPVCFLALLAYLESLAILSFCVWIIFYSCLQAIWGKWGLILCRPLELGSFFPSFFLSLFLIFVISFFLVLLLLSDLRHFAHSLGLIKGNKERGENLRKWWGKGQKDGCCGGENTNNIQRVWWDRLKVVFYSGIWWRRRKSQSILSLMFWWGLTHPFKEITQ